MSHPIGVPLTSDVIPAGTGIIQTVECLGADKKAPLALPVLAQVTTFANGMRRVCCPERFEFGADDESHCLAAASKKCIYAWKDPK